VLAVCASRRRNAGILAAVVTILLGVSGCTDLPPLPQGDPGPYRLDAGDQIRVITYGDERLSGTFRIGDGGTVEFPLVGPVAARGLTAEELEGKLASDLRARQLMEHPSVSVQVEQYRPVFILGEVSRPGRYPYEPGMTVLTVVAAAGGYTYRAARSQAVIEREIGHSATQGLVPMTAPVEPADVITIRERYF
jgi:polysaccharide export outer membrane protein